MVDSQEQSGGIIGLFALSLGEALCDASTAIVRAARCTQPCARSATSCYLFLLSRSRGVSALISSRRAAASPPPQALARPRRRPRSPRSRSRPRTRARSRDRAPPTTAGKASCRAGIPSAAPRRSRSAREPRCLLPLATRGIDSRCCVARSCRAKPEIWSFTPRAASAALAIITETTAARPRTLNAPSTQANGAGMVLGSLFGAAPPTPIP